MYSISRSECDTKVILSHESGLRRWTPTEARRYAFHLSMGAELACREGRTLVPAQYGLPGAERLTAFQAMDLSQELWDCASMITMEQLLSTDEGDWNSVVAEVVYRLAVEECDAPTAVVRIAE